MKRKRTKALFGNTFLKHLQQGKPYCVATYRGKKHGSAVSHRQAFKSAVALVRHKGAAPFVAAGTRALGVRPFEVIVDCRGTQTRQGSKRTAYFHWDEWSASKWERRP